MMHNQCVLTEYILYADLPEGLTLGVVSDLHEQEPEQVLELLRLGRPDIIFVPGDTFERHGVSRDLRNVPGLGRLGRLFRLFLMRADDLFERLTEKPEQCSEYAYRFLQEAGQIAPVYLSPGNHEWYFFPEDREAIRRSGCVLLDNQERKIRVKGVTLRIGGLSSVPDLHWVREFSARDGYKILLCHHPEYVRRYLKDLDIPLILSGHAHGGQIRIGMRGIYAPGQGLFPRYTKGIYDGRLLVTTGASNTSAIPRWGNPCEVVLIHLESASKRKSENMAGT